MNTRVWDPMLKNGTPVYLKKAMVIMIVAFLFERR